MMPPGGSGARGEAMAELALLIHAQNTAPQLQDWLEAAASEPLTPEQMVSLEAMRRRWRQNSLLPARLVEAKSLAGTRCEHAWREQRPNNDWLGFSANLQEVVTLAREEASIRADSLACSRYDAMVDLYEPGMTCTQLDQVFGDLKAWLPDLITRVVEKQKTSTPMPLQGPFPIAQQKQLGLEVMGVLGFDFNRGRLDESTHPFCGGVPTDVRITTRYDEHNFITALLGVIHETGHARYEQNLPSHWQGLPVGQARSMGIHESQSLFFEMQLARSAEFSQILAPLAAKHFSRTNDPAFCADNFYALTTRVTRGFIRVNADEATYPAHIILRYEIERALIDGSIEVQHIPELWAEKMQNYLGLDTKENYKNGCMQDIHWTDGSFGYFPSYTLGAIYAAQLMAAATAKINNLRSKIAVGELTELWQWLNSTIWHQASYLPTTELIQQATGEPLNALHFKRHLEARYDV